MSQKLTNDELLAQFDDLSGEQVGEAPEAPKPGAKTSKPKPPQADEEEDPLAELESLAKAAARPASRPNTPKLSTVPAATRNRSPKRGGIATPASSGSTRTSEDKTHVPNPPRKSGESTRSFHQSFTPTTDDYVPEKKAPVELQEPAPQQAGGGWWGGILSTATAAVKTAEAAYKDLQQNEEAQRWADQVKGNVGALRGLGDELRSRALPTFTNILHTLAPPISQHERLQIHITHDLVGYPSLDPLIFETFSRVMQQVEGGDLMVIQRGSESSQRRASETGARSSGWRDGPWWRQTESRNIGSVKGLVAGTKLARVGAESYANDFFGLKGGVEEAAKQATQVLSESNPVRSSDIFLAIQAISHESPDDLFGAPTEANKEEGVVEEKQEADELVSFAIYLYDPIHGISFHTLTQSFPLQWSEWLDATAAENELPPKILEIIEAGGVDPREWVAEWIEELLSLGIGVVAQRYVARRMGVGEGGIGRGKARQEAIESGGGEAARAGI